MLLSVTWCNYVTGAAGINWPIFVGLWIECYCRLVCFVALLRQIRKRSEVYSEACVSLLSLDFKFWNNLEKNLESVVAWPPSAQHPSSPAAPPPSTHRILTTVLQKIMLSRISSGSCCWAVIGEISYSLYISRKRRDINVRKLSCTLSIVSGFFSN